MSDAGGAVVVALAARPGGVASTLARRLEQDGRRVVALDPGADDAALAAAAAGAVALVYRPSLAPGRLEVPDLGEAERLLGALAGGSPGIERLVLLSSTLAYAPHHHHPGQLAEGQSHPPAGDHPVARRWRDLEALAAKALAGAPVTLTVARAAPVVGGGEGSFDRLLRRRLAFPVAGYRAPLQLLAPEDLAEAVARLLDAPGASGLFHVVPAGVVPARDALALAGVRALPVPYALQRLAAPAARLDYLRHPWTAAGRRLEEETGFRPRLSSAAAVLAAAGRDPAAAPQFDDFGLDPAYVAAKGRTLLRFLSRVYWRIEARGLENVPRQGPAVMAGVHRGFQPWDGVMTLHTVAEGTGRLIRFLVHPTLVKFPFLADFMTRLGGVLACRENADRLLARGELLGVYPEGIHGAFTPYRRAYELGKFGRDEFVRMALRNRAPIVPFVTVGSAEIYPILARLDRGWWKRWSEWPYFPITPTFPLVPLPLPSKWHTWFLPPLAVHERYPPEAAEDRALVQSLSQEVRRRLQEAIDWMRSRRRSIWRGAIFEDR
jgi:1-acyl-sn-glycerol-3-phosphate acyltransferase/nucleoside-diphosphate-sugar epimerase